MTNFPDNPNESDLENVAEPVEVSLGYPLPERSDFEPFDRRNITRERTSNLIFTAVVAIGLIVGAAFLYFSIGFNWLVQIGLGVAALLLLALAWFSLFWPSIEHRHRSWRLSDLGLEFHHGVWWKHRQAVPWARVQHADVSQGPLERTYGVGTLTVHTAGTSNSSVNLAGLSHERALEIRDEIIRQRTTDDVV